MLYFALFLVGLIFGSFANVLISRLPRGETPWNPAHSRCLACGQRLNALDNIPLISYLLLGGKCRYCGRPIGIRFFLVELILGLGFAAVALKLAASGQLTPATLILYAAFFFGLTVISFIDWETFTIPDALSLGLAAAMLAGAPWSIFAYTPLWWSRLLESLLGACAGGLFFWILAALGEKLYKREALGGGDIKLAFAIGAGLGLTHFFSVVMLSSLLGLLYALPLVLLKRLQRQDPIAYGPFLAAGALLVFFTGGLQRLFK